LDIVITKKPTIADDYVEYKSPRVAAKTSEARYNTQTPNKATTSGSRSRPTYKEVQSDSDEGQEETLAQRKLPTNKKRKRN
jgi:hypothetical protein